MFTKHAHDINEGNIKCFLNHLGPTYTREDVEDNGSWTTVTNKKRVSKPRKVSWSESVEQNDIKNRQGSRKSEERFLYAKNRR